MCLLKYAHQKKLQKIYIYIHITHISSDVEKWRCLDLTGVFFLLKMHFKKRMYEIGMDRVFESDRVNSIRNK